MIPNGVQRFLDKIMRKAKDPPSPRNQRSLLSRLMWFAGLWLAGVGTVAAVAYGIRLFIT